MYRWGTDNGKVLRAAERLDLGLPLRAVNVACGSKHTLILVESGHVLR